MIKSPEDAVLLYASSSNCSQAVLIACCGDAEIDTATAQRIAWGFGVGMGKKQEVCGAVTGGIMALSLLYDPGSRDRRSAGAELYGKINALMNRFQARHGSYRCRELLGDCDRSTEEGERYYMESGMKASICYDCVRSVMELVRELA